jgi:hypothetical protein
VGPAKKSATLVPVTKEYRMALSELLFQRYAGKVQGGLFKGLALSRETVWGIDGDLAPKILGTYEQQLHAPLADFLRRGPRVVVNVGAAEGYYVAGLARLLGSFVIAFEPHAGAREICLETARLNGASSRVEVRGACTSATLQEVLDGRAPALLVMDCEGAELEILEGLRSGSLDNTDLVIECHDFVEPRTTAGLQELFRDTHSLHRVFEDDVPRQLPDELRHWGHFEKAMAVCEFRRCPMHWLIGQALGR